MIDSRSAMTITLIFCFSVILAMVAVAQPKYENGNNPWPQVSNQKDVYNNWITYTKAINGPNKEEFTIKIEEDGKFKFAWKMESLSSSRLEFYIDANQQKNCDSTAFVESDLYDVKKGDVLKWRFSVVDQSNNAVWIAIPGVSTSEQKAAPNPQNDTSNQQMINNSKQSNCTFKQKSTTYNKKFITSSHILQKTINERYNYTELVLMVPECIVDDSLIIEHQDHLTISSGLPLRKVKIKPSKPSNKPLVNIRYSSNISLVNASLDCSDNDAGISIEKSDFSKIINNNINISCSGTGIFVESGKNNTIEENEIINTPNNCVTDSMSVGIKVRDAVNTYINNNKIRSYDGISRNSRTCICHYHILRLLKLNTTIIIPDNSNELVELRWGSCSCMWNGAYFSECYREGDTYAWCDGAIPNKSMLSYEWNY